jgi:hypothetical protein
LDHHIIWSLLAAGEDVHLKEALKDGAIRLKHGDRKSVV